MIEYEDYGMGQAAFQARPRLLRPDTGETALMAFAADMATVPRQRPSPIQSLLRFASLRHLSTSCEVK